ncbi:tyrosine-protein phosphatase [Sinobacterium caligoides]|nr:tyrosine-protein phosphatase [Sinobacterium caligoides]
MSHTIFSKLCSVAVISCSLIIASSLSGCNHREADQAPMERVVPAELNPVERERFRLLPLQGADNFRDLGGYQTRDGRTVKWGVLYRSDALSDLTDDDLTYLGRLKLQQIIDFRSEEERQADPDRIPDGAKLEFLPIVVKGTAIKELKKKLLSGKHQSEDFAQLLLDANTAFVKENSPVFKDYLHRLSDSDNLPLLFHCTAGKDRTGFAAAIALLAVGVPEETIRRDYMLTNVYTEDKVDRQILGIRLASLLRTDDEDVRPLLSVDQSYIETALTTMKMTYGSVDNYLVEALGITPTIREKLRNNLLQPTKERRHANLTQQPAQSWR